MKPAPKAKKAWRRLAGGALLIFALLPPPGGAAGAAPGPYLGEVRKAAEGGDASAQFSLGVLHLAGRGVPKDEGEAARWFQLSAEQGYPFAQSVLGDLHAEGRGVPRDLPLAHMWLALAEDQGMEAARSNRRALERRMTPAQLAEARRLAREWRPRKK